MIKFRSFGDAHEQYKGSAPGFDFLRLLLAVLIFYAHTKTLLPSASSSIAVVSGLVASSEPSGFLQRGIEYLRAHTYRAYVPMFFALSGYLVCGSALRLRSPLIFLSFRALRIFPALSVEVALSAVLLGAFLTTLPLGHYFSDTQFFRYFGNIFGFVSFYLPGVFESNPFPRVVNVNLWTLPAEFYSYLILVILMFLIDLETRRWWMLGSFAILSVVGTFFAQPLGAVLQSPEVTAARIFATPAVVAHFGLGVLFYLFRNCIPISSFLALISLIMTFALLPYKQMEYLISPFVVYVTVYIGYLAFLRSDLLRKHDFSYGIYLYGFPIKQTLVALIPGIQRTELLFAALLVTIGFAMFSWIYIEKPFLALKTRISRP